MTILQYYIDKHQDEIWVQNFQSTAQDKNGKLFNCLNVNFRSLKAYYSQLKVFADKSGLKRSEWNDFQENGQEKDKHRISSLKNAKFIIQVDDSFFITEKGKTVISINSNDELNDQEKWILMFMLLIDFQLDGELDIVMSVLDLSSKLRNFNVDAISLMKMLKDAFFTKKKEELFNLDIFWLISFYKDEKFINLFQTSSKEEKCELIDWVLSQFRNANTIDCIARKYNSTAYSASMFNEDIKIILSTLILITLQDENYINYINLLSKLHIDSVRVEIITNIINENTEVFNETYSNSIGYIKLQLNLED